VTTVRLALAAVLFAGVCAGACHHAVVAPDAENALFADDDAVADDDADDALEGAETLDVNDVHDAAHDASMDILGEAGDVAQDDVVAAAADVPPATWLPVAGTLTAGTWSEPVRLDAATGDFGQATYTPNGDLFVFYSVLPPSTKPVPDQLKLRKRLAGSPIFAPEIAVMANGRVAHPYFDPAGTIHAAIENSGTATIYTSTDGGNVWIWDVSYAAFSGIGDGAWNNAFVTSDGSHLHVWYGFTAFSTVTGAGEIQVYGASEGAGKWNDTPIDATPYQSLKLGLQGAFQDGNTMLLLATKAFRSTDNGGNFAAVWPDTLAGIGGASRSATDSRIFAVNLDSVNTSKAAQIWGTTDLGATFLPLQAIAPGGVIFRTAIVATANRVLAIVSMGTEPGGSMLLGTYSLDGGATWSKLETVVDVSGSTLDAVSLSAAGNGWITLVYSTQKGDKRDGVYAMDWK
jgi:hypothetical protein